MNPRHLVLILPQGCVSKQLNSLERFTFRFFCCAAANGKNSLKHTEKNKYVVYYETMWTFCCRWLQSVIIICCCYCIYVAYVLDLKEVRLSTMDSSAVTL